MIILTKWYLECILSLRIVNSKEKEGMASEILLSKDLMHLKFRYNRCISILKLYLFLLDFIPIELHWNFKLYCLYYFFLENASLQLGMRLIYGCGLYVDFYGIISDQNLVQDVQGLSSIGEQKIAGPKIFFNYSYRPMV